MGFSGGEGPPPPGNGGLPDLPPEWGVVVIPDDPAELDRESAELRRERRRAARRARWRRRFGLPPRTDIDGGTAPIGTPLLIMAIAIVAALTSLFAITLSTRTATVTNSPPTTTTAAAPTPLPAMIDLALPDGSGKKISIRDTLPAVILLLDGCDCQTLIRETSGAAPPNVTLLLVDKSAPAVPAGVSATALADPQQALRATYGDGPDRRATPLQEVIAVLVDRNGTVTATARNTTTVQDFREALQKLAS